MSARSYWVDLFTWTTWQEFLAAGGQTSGFRPRSCYLVGLHRFIGLLEVVSAPFQDTKPIWKDDVYPCRIGVKMIVGLTAETALPIHELRDQLTIFRGSTDPRWWGVHLQRSPTRWKESDGEAVTGALLEAKKNPVERPVPQTKLKSRPRLLRVKQLGLVTIPDDQDAGPTAPALPQRESLPRFREESASASELAKEVTVHTEIQWLLLKLGSDMGLDVWVAKNDRGRSFGDRSFTDLWRLKLKLPVQFEEATNRTIELIDVLWLRGNAIVAAFEVESTTSIYSGLLRMSDLVAMQPNINIPLYLVAPDERREKVLAEVNRPTFSRLSPPLNRICRFISFSSLRQRISQLGATVQYLRPDFIAEELSEPCTLEQV